MATNRTIELEPNESALIIGEEDGSMTVRVVPAVEPEDGAEMSEPLEISVALATRLLEDPDFHDDVLEWYEEQEESEDDDEPEADEDEDKDEKAPKS